MGRDPVSRRITVRRRRVADPSFVSVFMVGSAVSVVLVILFVGRRTVVLRLRGGLWMLLGMIRSVVEIGRSVVAFAIMFVVIGRVGIVSSELAIGIVRVVVLVTVPSTRWGRRMRRGGIRHLLLLLLRRMVLMRRMIGVVPRLVVIIVIRRRMRRFARRMVRGILSVVVAAVVVRRRLLLGGGGPSHGQEGGGGVFAFVVVGWRRRGRHDTIDVFPWEVDDEPFLWLEYITELYTRGGRQWWCNY